MLIQPRKEKKRKIVAKSIHLQRVQREIPRIRFWSEEYYAIPDNKCTERKKNDVKFFFNFHLSHPIYPNYSLRR